MDREQVDACDDGQQKHARYRDDGKVSGSATRWLGHGGFGQTVCSVVFSNLEGYIDIQMTNLDVS